MYLPRRDDVVGSQHASYEVVFGCGFGFGPHFRRVNVLENRNLQQPSRTVRLSV